MKILVLGHMGMLGNMVHTYLRRNENLNVVTVDTTLKWPSIEFKDAVHKLSPDTIVNCIGAIHQKVSDFRVNYELPIWLDSLGCKIIHPNTDCENDDTEYGISKRTAKDFIVTIGQHTHSIKTSIIGPELQTKYSLFNWFLSHSDGEQVNGFTNHFWNGITTLKWAEICERIIMEDGNYPVEMVVKSNCISKYKLLCIINKVFDRNIVIHPTENIPIDRCVSGIYVGSIERQLHELKEFLNENN